MHDEEIRRLERAALAGDAAARLRVARAVARTDHLGTALARIDLARVPWADYEAQRAYTDALWLEHFRGLAPAVRVPGEYPVVQIVAASRASLLGWIGGGRNGPMIADARTGARLDTGDFPVIELHASEDAVFSQYRATVLRRYLRKGDDALDVTPSVISPGRVHDVSPGGDLALVGGPGDATIGIHEIPSLRSLLEKPAGSRDACSVDWASREVVFTQRMGDEEHVSLVSFEDATLWSHVATWSWKHQGQFRALGRGAVACEREGLTLHFRDGRTIPLLEARNRAVASLASDGRCLRVHLESGPHRFIVDRERGVLVAGEPLLGRKPREWSPSALWHPHANLACVRRKDGAFVLVSTEEGVVAELGRDVLPQAWIEDGRALLVLRDARRVGPEVTIEVWR
jgi:hypothetical protein